jgi:alpha-glucosidase (family GH31 glycosyl hydrolase)
MGGFEHVADPELYIRWVQFGMFSPVAMVFGMDHPGYKEPWSYGGDALRNFKKYDSLRYQLLPYIYSNAYQMYKTGAPLMRALVFDYQDDGYVYVIGDQYLLGQHLMVCPVTTKGAQTRTVYFPEGEWYDWWTGKKYNGKQYANVLSPLDTMPIFARAGAIIPMQPAMNYVGEKRVDTITLDIFPGNGSFALYEDGGDDLGYQQGNFCTTNISVRQNRISIDQPQGKFKPSAHKYLVKFHAAKKPSAVTENGKANSAWWYSEKEKAVYVPTAGDNSKNITLQVAE